MVFRPGWISLCAFACLLPALTSRADTATEQFQRAAASYQAGVWQQAAEQFALFLREEGGSSARRATALFYRGESLVQLRDYHSAINVYQEYCRAAPPQDPNRQRALSQIGFAASATGDLVVAEMALNQFLAACAEEDRAACDAAKMRLADVCFRAKNYLRAATLFEEVAASDATRRDEALYGCARALELAHRYDQARQVYKTLAATPEAEHADRALLALGLMEMQQQDFRASLDELRRLTMEHPQSDLLIESYDWIGQIHLRSDHGRHDAELAQAAFCRAIEIANSTERLTQHQASLLPLVQQRLETANARLRKFEQNQLVETQITQETHFADPWSQAADARDAGKLRKAARTYLRIAAQQPGSIEAQQARFAAAECYAQAGRNREAVDLYRRLAKSDEVTIAQTARQRLAAGE